MAYRATDRLAGDFAYVREMDLRLRLFCERPKCHHSADLDLAALIARHGAAHTLHDFILACVCSCCGARFPDLMLQSSPNYERIAREASASDGYYALLEQMRKDGRLR